MSRNQKYIFTAIVGLFLAVGGFLLWSRYLSPESIFGLSDEEEEEVAAHPCDTLTMSAVEWNEAYNTPSTPWLTYHSEPGEIGMFDPRRGVVAEGYRIDYPSVLQRSPDTHPPEVVWDDRPHEIGVSVVDAGLYQHSLDVFLDTLAPTGMRLERRIQIDGHDAIVTSNASDREERRDVLFVEFIKGGTLYSIRTQCLDHERVWNSFRFEE